MSKNGTQAKEERDQGLLQSLRIVVNVIYALLIFQVYLFLEVIFGENLVVSLSTID